MLNEKAILETTAASFGAARLEISPKSLNTPNWTATMTGLVVTKADFLATSTT